MFRIRVPTCTGMRCHLGADSPYSPKFPIRQLRESVDAKDRFFFEG
jgi:hypothetical protein